MSRFFAIIPAAGTSSRMGAAKLLLPVDGGAMIEKTLAAWKASGVDRIVVVVRPDDVELADVSCACGVEVVVPPTAPPEMKDSVQHGLRHIEENFAPAADDAWLLAPADMPSLSAQVIGKLTAEFQAGQKTILVPTLGGKRGHPVLFPWSLAKDVFTLRADEGLNVLRQRHECREIPCDAIEPAGERAFGDIDTPEDYERLRN